MKIVPAHALVFPNLASVQKNLLELKTMMTALSKADIDRLKTVFKAAPKGRRSKSAPSKMPNAAAVTFRNVTVCRKRGTAKRDRGQPPSRMPNGMPSAETTPERGTRRRSNMVDVVPAPNIGLKPKPKKNVSVNACAKSGPWLRSAGPVDGAVANLTRSRLGTREPSKNPCLNVEKKQDRADGAARKKRGKRGRRKKAAFKLSEDSDEKLGKFFHEEF
ncbi:hypothetical protein AAVH_32563 [Aphelenchoides avenae]|nr:hypothetical protein AAVH_32563 [Aphelenchus avenae]